MTRMAKRKNPIIISKLSDKGYPTHSKDYKTAHAEANRAEKKKYPKGYAKLKKEEKHLGKHELMGKNTRANKIEVEKKFKKNKNEIAYHEEVEHKVLKRLVKERKKK